MRERLQRLYRNHPRATYGLYLATVIVVIFASIEAFFHLFLVFPGLNNVLPFAKPVIRDIYMGKDRNIITFLEECTVYDPQLTYTLRPGNCRFRNREFDTLVTANSLGLRDEEEALEAPEAIFLGDSYTMGWGVEQHESFPELVESLTGLKTLNGGISSYGTPREIRLLERLDTSALKYVVFQYSWNDLGENLHYLAHGNELRISTPERLADVHERFPRRPRYEPLRYLRAFLAPRRAKLKEWLESRRAGSQADFDGAGAAPAEDVELTTEEESTTGDPAAGELAGTATAPSEDAADPAASDTGYPEWNFSRQGEFFLRILAQASIPDGVKVVFLDLSPRNTNDNWVEDQIREQLERSEYAGFVEELEILDVAAVLEDSDYFVLDDHLNASGHRKVAEVVAASLAP